MATLLVRVAAVKAQPPETRTEKVNQLLALDSSRDEKHQLQQNALLVTALREQGVWPQGCR